MYAVQIIFLICVGVTSSTGILTLGVTYSVMRKAEVYNTPYGILMQARCVHSVLVLFFFLGWIELCVFLNWDEIYPKLNDYIGLAAMFSNFCVFVTAALLSALRFFNMYFPLSADKQYNKYGVLINIGIFFSSAVYTFVYYYYGCVLCFDFDSRMFRLFPSSSRLYDSFIGDYVFPVIFYFAVLLFDLGTVIKLRRNRRRISGSFSELQEQRRQRQETFFAVQTLIHVYLCLLLIICCHFLPQFESTAASAFFCARYLWCFVVACGGYFPIIFDKEVAKFIRAKIYGIPAIHRVSQMATIGSQIVKSEISKVNSGLILTQI